LQKRVENRAKGENPIGYTLIFRYDLFAALIIGTGDPGNGADGTGRQ